MKIILQVNGQERIFSEEELRVPLEKYFANTSEVAKTPTEGKWFQVNPSEINQTLFQTERSDELQEQTRLLILDAFNELNNHPKYNQPFETTIPKQCWLEKTGDELKVVARELGGHITVWVEQSLEWAQRIFNGESWTAVCNESDTADLYRLVIWKDGSLRLIGGSRMFSDSNPPTKICDYPYHFSDKFDITVPAVTRYRM